MIAGLSPAAWLLMTAAVVPALVLVAVFYAAHVPRRSGNADRNRQEP